MTTTITILNHGPHPVVVAYTDANRPLAFAEVVIQPGKFSQPLVLHGGQQLDVREATPVTGTSDVKLPGPQA